jgi:hypothetical protein
MGPMNEDLLRSTVALADDDPRLADEVVLLSHDVAAMFNDLGVLMAVRGRIDEAERFYRRSLEIRQRLHLGGDHPETALTRRNLAVLPAG